MSKYDVRKSLQPAENISTCNTMKSDMHIDKAHFTRRPSEQLRRGVCPWQRRRAAGDPARIALPARRVIAHSLLADHFEVIIGINLNRFPAAGDQTRSSSS